MELLKYPRIIPSAGLTISLADHHNNMIGQFNSSSRLLCVLLSMSLVCDDIMGGAKVVCDVKVIMHGLFLDWLMLTENNLDVNTNQRQNATCQRHSHPWYSRYTRLRKYKPISEGHYLCQCFIHTRLIDNYTYRYHATQRATVIVKKASCSPLFKLGHRVS